MRIARAYSPLGNNPNFFFLVWSSPIWRWDRALFCGLVCSNLEAGLSLENVLGKTQKQSLAAKVPFPCGAGNKGGSLDNQGTLRKGGPEV